MLYNPPANLTDSSPSAWVAARSEGGASGAVVDGRGGTDYVLVLSAVTATNVPAPGTFVDAVGAPVGTCLRDVLHDGSPTGSLEVAACETEHFAEIYHAGEADPGEVDGDTYAQYQDSALRQRAEAFQPLVGVPANLSLLSAEPFAATKPQWQAGERMLNCVLSLGTEDYSLVGSARDSWR